MSGKNSINSPWERLFETQINNSTKENTDDLDYIKIKNCPSKDDTEATEWETSTTRSPERQGYIVNKIRLPPQWKGYIVNKILKILG